MEIVLERSTKIEKGKSEELKELIKKVFDKMIEKKLDFSNAILAVSQLSNTDYENLTDELIKNIVEMILGSMFEYELSEEEVDDEHNKIILKICPTLKTKIE